MPIVTWSDSYSVNVQSMDTQHKKLFDLINRFHDAMSSGKGKEMVGTVVKEMLDYTQTHFTAEERLMERHQYPGLDEQRKQHALFIDKVSEMQQKLAAGKDLGLAIEASQFLKQWLVNHIQTIDKKYGPFLSERGAL